MAEGNRGMGRRLATATDGAGKQEEEEEALECGGDGVETSTTGGAGTTSLIPPARGPDVSAATGSGRTSGWGGGAGREMRLVQRRRVAVAFGCVLCRRSGVSTLATHGVAYPARWGWVRICEKGRICDAAAACHLALFGAAAAMSIAVVVAESWAGQCLGGERPRRVTRECGRRRGKG
ncbi:unnamed protein product [Lampetra fluviatilis]